MNTLKPNIVFFQNKDFFIDVKIVKARIKKLAIVFIFKFLQRGKISAVNLLIKR